ncbi:MAG: acetyl-CoA carboxylase biotin carboxyl carrier protein [Candidatus Hydrogenedentes bacterium]|nr:acetyl-CoA carboxylase biotin carboxyl carrier protein [Candidatus Hydrogenedentota bacterium]
MDLNEIKDLISLLEESGLSELEIEEEGRRIRLTKQHGPVVSMGAPPMYAPAAIPAAETAHAHAAAPAAPASPADEGLVTIDSPMVGTFYGSPAPGEPLFVQPGDRVTADQTVCIVEAMKIMNEVAAKVAGTIERVLVESGEPVEFGQPLFAVRPA